MRWIYMRSASVLLMVVLLAALAALAAPRPVHASEATPPPAAQGMDGLVPPPDGIQQGNQPTLAERYPTTAYDIPVDGGSAFINTFHSNPVDQAANVTQSALYSTTELAVLQSVVMLTIRLVEWSASFDLVGASAGPVGQSTQALAETVYTPLLLVVVLITGGWLIWHILVKRHPIKGLEGASWSIGVMVAAGIYFVSPVPTMTAVNQLTGALGQGILAGMTTADPTMVTRAGDPEFAKGDPTSAELRAFADRLWHADVFVPWSVAVFGDAVSGQKYGEAFLQAHAAGQDYTPTGASQAVIDWYHGGNGAARTTILGVALGVALLMCLLYLAIAGLGIAAQFGLLILFMILPLFLLVGVHPGWGRQKLMRWLDLFLMVLALRILASAGMGVLLILTGIIASLPNWGVSVALQVALVLTIWIGRRHFFSMYGRLVDTATSPATQSFAGRTAQAGWQRVTARVRPTVAAATPVSVKP